jgi:hypothetical protein
MKMAYTPEYVLRSLSGETFEAAVAENERLGFPLEQEANPAPQAVHAAKEIVPSLGEIFKAQTFTVTATEYIRGHCEGQFTVGTFPTKEAAEEAAQKFYERNRDRDHSVFVSGIGHGWPVYPK